MRAALKGKAPGLRLERGLWAEGAAAVAGVDEVGRGSWAGPLTVAAVVTDPRRRIYKVRDSKLLTAVERELLYERIMTATKAVAVGHATVTECNELGMSAAQRLAAARALEGLDLTVDHVLVDGSWDFVGGARTTTVVGGDASCLSIAAASIVAKVTRDRIMRASADLYPLYRFEANKGYPCPRHLAALAAWGPCAIHRRRWVFMDGLRWTGVARLQGRPGNQIEIPFAAQPLQRW